MNQMNENSERLRVLEAENKDLQNKLDTIATTATPPLGFDHVRSDSYNTMRDESVGFTKCGSRHPSDRTSSQHTLDT
ncbi:hypothetical protein ACOSQ2_013723 [Xanthoceras sorbifolium]